MFVSLALACTARPPSTPPGEAQRQLQATTVVTAPAPSDRERYCAWYGDARQGVLYFGEAPFWSELRRASGDAAAELREPGPQAVGRFDLARERLLAPLATGARDPRSGTWDVLAHPNGRVYFTTFYEAAGYVDPASGATQLFESAGTGLNELALGPDGTILATRYAAQGSVVVLDPDGAVLAEHGLAADPGFQVAPKSLSFDPLRREIWVNTDLVPASVTKPAPDGAGVGHDARVLDFASGRELRRIGEPELQFMRFEQDGVGLFVWLAGSHLVLRMSEPGAAPGPASGREVVLDDAFPAHHDFVQDLSVAADGRVLATRWSGTVHVVSPAGEVRTAHLPRLASGGLYYTAVASDGRLCATYCADVSVVCAPLP